LCPVVYEHNVNSLKCVSEPWVIETTRCVNKTMYVVCVIIFKIINWPTNNKTFSNWQKEYLVATRWFIENNKRGETYTIEIMKWLNKERRDLMGQ
jgi:hypothetical protein